MALKISVEIARDGSLIPMINDISVHSSYQAVIEGQRLAEQILRQNPSPDMPIVVYGLGFGYHIRPLLQSFTNIYVLESLTELIDIAKETKVIDDIFSKIKIISDLDNVPYLPEHLSLTLRSEYRWQEEFFNEANKRLQTEKTDYQIKADEIRVLVNFPIYGGSFTTAEYVSNAFNKIGCTVENMDNSIANQILQYTLQNSKNKNGLIQKLTEVLSDLLWEKFVEFKPHIIFCLAQAPIDYQVINAIRKTGTIVAFWFVEDYRRFPYWSDVVKYIDAFFYIQRGEFESIIEEYAPNKGFYLPMAADNNLIELAKNDKREDSFYHADVSFMGAAFANRVNFFTQIHNYDLKMWGTGWYDFEHFKNKCPLQDERISIPQAVKIYQNSKININLHSSMDENIFNKFGDFVNPRTFEILACGGFQLVDDSQVIREFFTPDEDLVVFSSIPEAIDKIDFYLKNSDIREKIAKNGYQKTMNRYTYKHRMIAALAILVKANPILANRVEAEQNRVTELALKINDKKFIEVLNSINPALRNDPKSIFKAFEQEKDNIRYQAIFKLLETFYEGE
ncbi:MAG: glycosyltransferase [Candidatus Cloacimonetes bacterium]|nr:glycosyltransferase [Candidatus Cloacimonadota bacterium]